MDESVIRPCILFLGLVSPDPAKVFTASEYILDLSRRKKARYVDHSLLSLVIGESTKMLVTERWNKIPAKREKAFKPALVTDLLTKIRNFKETIKKEEYEAFVWLECVRAPIADVALALGLSEGTLRYRAYRGLKSWIEYK